MVSVHSQLTKSIFLNFVLLLALLLKFVPGDSQSDLRLVDWGCIVQYGNYTENSPYQEDLKSENPSRRSDNPISHILLPQLHSRPRLYCRGDVTPSVCHECEKEAATFVLQKCTEENEAVLYYEQCTMFALAEFEPWTYDNFRTANASDPDKFEQILSDTIDRLINKASFDHTSRSFATGDAPLSSSQTLYCLVQCTPDLTSRDCYSCFRSAFDYSRTADCCSAQKLKLLIFQPSCQVMWDTTQFYSIRPPPPPPPSSPPTPSLSSPITTPAGKKKGIGYYLVSVGLPVVAAHLRYLSG